MCWQRGISFCAEIIFILVAIPLCIIAVCLCIFHRRLCCDKVRESALCLCHLRILFLSAFCYLLRCDFFFRVAARQWTKGLCWRQDRKWSNLARIFLRRPQWRTLMHLHTICLRQKKYQKGGMHLGLKKNQMCDTWFVLVTMLSSFIHFYVHSYHIHSNSK